MTTVISSESARSAVEEVAAVTSRRDTVVDLAQAALSRASEVEDRIHAFCYLDEQAVLASAEAVDRHGDGPLKGLVVGVKDVIDTVDMPTTYGSPLFAGHQPAHDAAIVATIRRLGGLVLGKTSSTEFAMFEPTDTRNPVDLTRTPGGSSSGSAAAVAAGVLPVALGTQTAGSVVRPAAYCGIYGFKPSRGWTSTEGVFPLAASLDTLGILARSIGDLRLVYEAVRSSPPVARQDGRRLKTVAVLPAIEWGDVEPESLDALRSASARLAAHGLMVVDLDMPTEWLALPFEHETVMAFETARCLRQLLGDRVNEISPSSQSVVARGETTRQADYESSLDAARRATEVLQRLSRTVDMLLTPSALGVAPSGLDFTGDPVMCRPWTLLGLPTANLPTFRTDAGLPVGIQAVSLVCDDAGFLDDLEVLETLLSTES